MVDNQTAYTERVNRLLSDFLEIVPSLTAVSPELRSHLLEMGPPRFPPSLIEPQKMHRLATMLHGDPKPSISDLGKALSVPLSTASRIVSMLEEQGLARKIPDLEDGRSVRVDLTDPGREIYEQVLDHGIRNARRMLDCLTTEEQLILLTLLDKVAAKLKRDI